ncbi:MAG: hypothetical protein QM770_12005 [Tepidisphaeraceae bacterium]
MIAGAFRLALLLSLTLTVTGAWAVSEPTSQPTTRPATMILHLPTAPYPHPSRKDGYKSGDETFPMAGHYDDDSVGIYVPEKFKAPDGPADFVIHFHGHRNHVTKVFEQYDLAGQMEKSGVNAILVVPQGPYEVPDSSFGKMADEGGFAAMMNDVANELVKRGVLRSAQIGRIVLAGHSGGYLPVATVLDHGGLTDHITDVLLFDASYGSLDSYVNYISDQTKPRRLISICTAHLAGQNMMMMAMLQDRGVKYEVKIDGKLTDDIVRPRGPLFIHTRDLAHGEVLGKRDYMAMWVRTSALADK